MVASCILFVWRKNILTTRPVLRSTIGGNHARPSRKDLLPHASFVDGGLETAEGASRIIEIKVAVLSWPVVCNIVDDILQNEKKQL